ncbi:MAG: rRNA maturation RNase YbeY [bacterium]|nr:rRNA maturation RNase YbeY [bacterium]
MDLIITNKTKGATPKVPFVDLKEAVLGNKYELSLVFIGNRRSARLNMTYRKKPKSTNILSFPLDKNCGEIFIDLSLAKKQAFKFDRTFPNFVAYLFIHGLFHLKGMQHGLRMKSAEKKIRDKFKI